MNKEKSQQVELILFTEPAIPTGTKKISPRESLKKIVRFMLEMCSLKQLPCFVTCHLSHHEHQLTENCL